MNDRQTFAISAAGMDLERKRVDLATLNLANANTVLSVDGTGFHPMRVVARSVAGAFPALVGTLSGKDVNAAGAAVSIEPVDVTPRQAYEPGHPYADARGFVRYAGVDTAGEMVTMMSAIRSYQANVAAMNTTRQMALKALEIGG